MSEPTSRSDDDLLAIYDRLNHQFYTAEPARYFHQRWLSLMLLAGRTDEVTTMLRSGVSYEHVSVDAAEVSAEGVHHYVSMESQVLLHQVSETLLRLFLAHWSSSGCPWLDLASERTPGKFKRRVEEEIIGLPLLELQEPVLFVFLGDAQLRPKALPVEAWQRGIANLIAFLRSFASRWLEDAPLYNSLKHGLSVVPGEVQLAFAEQPDLSDARVFGHGTSVDFLDSEVSGPKRRAWKQTTRWLDVGESLALAEVAQHMIESMWLFGRARYAGGPVPKRLFVPTDIGPHTFRSPNRGSAMEMTRPLGIDEQT